MRAALLHHFEENRVCYNGKISRPAATLPNGKRARTIVTRPLVLATAARGRLPAKQVDRACAADRNASF